MDKQRLKSFLDEIQYQNLNFLWVVNQQQIGKL